MCSLVCGIISRSVAATGWSVRLISRFRLNGLYGLVIEFWQQLAFWIALCVVTSTILFFIVEHFVPPAVERILCGLKPFFYFFRLLAVAISLLRRFSCSKCVSEMMCASSSGLFPSPEGV